MRGLVTLFIEPPSYMHSVHPSIVTCVEIRENNGCSKWHNAKTTNNEKLSEMSISQRKKWFKADRKHFFLMESGSL
jgi:hypothetical protein